MMYGRFVSNHSTPSTSNGARDLQVIVETFQPSVAAPIVELRARPTSTRDMGAVSVRVCGVRPQLQRAPGARLARKVNNHGQPDVPRKPSLGARIPTPRGCRPGPPSVQRPHPLAG